MGKYFHFTITSDARKHVPRMILTHLADEYIWQGQEYQYGAPSVKDRAKRVRQLIETEITKRNVQQEFKRLMARANNKEDE